MLKKSLPHGYFIGLFILAFLIRIYLFSRRKSDATALDIYNILQILITVLLGFYLIIRKDSKPVLRLIIKSPIGYILLLYLIGVISGLWSAMPLFSTYFGIEGLIYILALSIIFYNQENFRNFERLAINSSYLFILLLVFEIIRLKGFRFNLFNWHTNTYSTIAAMLFGYCYGEFNNHYRIISPDERKVLKKGIWSSLFFVVLGTSSASNISLVAGLMAVTIISGKKSFKILSVLFFSLLLVLNQIYGELFFNILFPGKTIEGASFMHGRMTLWEYYFEQIKQKPLLGWGFASIERISKIYATTTHNSIIEILGGVGILGLFAFALYIFRIYFLFLINKRRPYLVGVIGALTAGLVNSNSISFIGSPTSALFLAFIIWNLLGYYYLLANLLMKFKKTMLPVT